jgi:hypothetical protein
MLQEKPVHYALEMSGKAHARVGELRLGKSCEKSKQEKEHSMPEQPTLESS